jgi:hypothetical protein
MKFNSFSKAWYKKEKIFIAMMVLAKPKGVKKLYFKHLNRCVYSPFGYSITLRF